MAKPKPRDKEANPGHEIIRNMPPRARAGAVAWLHRESGTEPMLFEMAQALGLIEYRPVTGQWVGVMFGVTEEFEPIPVPAPVVDVEPITKKTTKAAPAAKPVKPTGQLELF